MLCSLFKGDGEVSDEFDVVGDGGGNDAAPPLTTGDTVGAAGVDTGLVDKGEA